MIYADYQATTPLAPEVAEVIGQFLEGARFGNPHSSDHAFGLEAARVVEEARNKVAKAIGARPSEVLFTSGATEANNTAILGTIQTRDHLLVSAIEHACVLEPAKHLQALGTALSIVDVDALGVIAPEAVEAAIRPETKLLSIMLVNNEIATIQPIIEIARICRKHGVLLHCDAAQALGRLPLCVKSLGVDLLSLSAHKAYGPKGVGAMFIRRGVKLRPILHGGGQEKLLRSGTLSPMFCAGFGVAAELANQRYLEDQERGGVLINRLLDKLRAASVNFSLNAERSHTVRDAVSLHFPNITTQTLLSRMPDIAVSSASACSGAKGASSHVLAAMGHDPTARAANIRLSVGRPSTNADIDTIAERIIVATEQRPQG